jgi:hypothetical protein
MKVNLLWVGIWDLTIGIIQINAKVRTETAIILFPRSSFSKYIASPITLNSHLGKHTINKGKTACL